MCESCKAVNINGMNCRETGCPAWKDKTRNCLEEDGYGHTELED